MTLCFPNNPPSNFLTLVCVTQRLIMLLPKYGRALFPGGWAAHSWPHHWTNDSPFPGNHYLPVAPQGGVGTPEYHVHLWWLLEGLILYRSFQVAKHVHCEFMSSRATWWQEGSICAPLSKMFCKCSMEWCRLQFQDELFGVHFRVVI